MVKDAVDQICDVLEIQDPGERDEYTLYVITNSGALVSHCLVKFLALNFSQISREFILNFKAIFMFREINNFHCK